MVAEWLVIWAHSVKAHRFNSQTVGPFCVEFSWVAAVFPINPKHVVVGLCSLLVAPDKFHYGDNNEFIKKYSFHSGFEHYYSCWGLSIFRKTDPYFSYIQNTFAQFLVLIHGDQQVTCLGGSQSQRGFIWCVSEMYFGSKIKVKLSSQISVCFCHHDHHCYWFKHIQFNNFTNILSLEEEKWL